MAEQLFDRTGILFARPSFLEGVGRIIDFGASLNIYNESQSTALADLNAITSDWASVGDSLRSALISYSSDLEKAGK